MLLCGSANRAKSWSCEHCVNFLKTKNPEICKTCYWAYPEAYTHVATAQQRRLDIVWVKEEIAQYEWARETAHKNNKQLPEFVKEALEKAKKKNG